MSLFQRKTEHTEHDNRPTNVLPGIIATVVDDKKNEVYLDLDLELEPEETSESRATTLRGHIPPGLVATVNKKNTLKDFDIRHFLQKHLNEAILISCAAIVAVLAAIATYLMYANPVARQTSYPVVKPLQPLEPVSASNQPQPHNEPVKTEARQNPSDQNIEKEYPNYAVVENTSSVTVQKPAPTLDRSTPQKKGTGNRLADAC